MGLRSTIKSAVKSGFKALGDIPVEVTFREVTGTSYDTDTGDVIENHNSFTVERAVFTDYKKEELSRLSEKATEIYPTDKKLLMLAEDLQTSYIEAGTGATIITPVDVETFDYVLVGLTKYLIINAKQDPSETLWTLQVRKP